MTTMKETIAFRCKDRLKKSIFFNYFVFFVPKYLERKDNNAEKDEAIGEIYVCKFYLPTLCACAIWAIQKQTKP